MRRIQPPSESANYTYRLCAQSVRNAAERTRLLSVEADIVAAAEVYVEAAMEAGLHQIPQSPDVAGTVTKKEMIKLYENHMARKGAAARGVYDRLMSAPQHKRCPLCGQRVVSTLDHHLPESIYPTFSVFPHNLVPACKDCNKEKGAATPQDAGQQTMHPYFDDFETERWLYAGVVHTQPAAVQFFVRPPDHWEDIKKLRNINHFKLLKLDELYASHAAEELLNIRHGLIDLLINAGREGVRQHLQSEAESRSAAHVNSWQTATYEALAIDDWFCDGAFTQA
jgi:hypothetical protein